MQRLKVSENRRFLVHEDGTPFFYLADTAWELFHRLNRDQARHYLSDRAAKGFTVIQAVALAEFHGLSVPNPEGHTPLHDNDPTRPNDAYFQHVDRVIDIAASLGLYIALLPTWGDKWNGNRPGHDPAIFTSANALAYGQYLGKRYRDKPVIWVLGGDRPIETGEHMEITRAMAQGIKRGDEGRHLITFHPPGARSSSQWLHEEDWLDFNMAQTGHSRDARPYEFIQSDYARQPAKPCVNGEPAYEDHPNAFKIDPVEFYLDQTDVRTGFYWSVFAGAMGHTYGCHDIWQMWTPDQTPINAPRFPWEEALDLPGARQMQYGRRLIESRPYLSRLPDQSLVVDPPTEHADHVQACRDAKGRYALIYIPTGLPVTIDLDQLTGDMLHVHWFDPRTGSAAFVGDLPRRGAHSFTPPTQGPGNDWVLVLDDAQQDYPAPGRSSAA